MNTSRFDKHAKNNLAVYHNFMTGAKYVVIASAICLLLMAYFLL